MPPLAVTTAVPSLFPLQSTSVDVAVAASTAGSVTLTVAVDEHPKESVMVHVYVPIVRPVAIAAVPPEGIQLYESVPDPVAFTVAVPFVPPLHDGEVDVTELTTGSGISVTVIPTEAESKQPLTLVLVMLYTPGTVATYVFVLAPGIMTPFRYHWLVPPELPVSVVLPPVQKFAFPLSVTTGSEFTVTVSVAAEVHPFASVAVIVYVSVAVGLRVWFAPPRFPGIQLNVTTPVPPVDDADAFVPDPAQIVEGVAEALATSNAGCVMLNVCVVTQLLASVTVQVHVPTVSPVTEAVPSPVGLPGVQL